MKRGRKQKNRQETRFDDVGMRYFALGARGKNSISKTKKRHISARTTERWRFLILLVLGVLGTLAFYGAWQEWAGPIP